MRLFSYRLQKLYKHATFSQVLKFLIYQQLCWRCTNATPFLNSICNKACHSFLNPIRLYTTRRHKCLNRIQQDKNLMTVGTPHLILQNPIVNFNKLFTSVGRCFNKYKKEVNSYFHPLCNISFHLELLNSVEKLFKF